MNKYGEITRINHNGISYILGAEKIQSSHLIDDPFIPNLLFYRTKKTSKKIFSKNLKKYERAYGLSDNLFNAGLIRKIINGYSEYLKKVKPQYVCYLPYGENDEYDKRHKCYGIILNRLGYQLLGKCRDEEYRIYYYYEKIST